MIFKFQINIKINIILLAATFVFAQVFQALAFNNVTYATCPTSEIRYKCRDCIKTRIDDSSRSGGGKNIQEILADYRNGLTTSSSQFDISWVYLVNSKFYTRHVFVSFYIKEPTDKDNYTRALSGCCHIPLKDNGCSTKSQIIGHLYASISLFRVSTVKYIGFQEEEEDFFAFGMSEATIDVSLNRNFETNVARPMGNTPPKVFVNYASYALAELYSYVCVFEVLKEPIVENSNRSAIESHLFKRDVYEVSGFSYREDSVYRDCRNTSCKTICESREFNETTLYNVTFDRNSSTLTCMLLWLSLNDTDDAKVRCMEHQVAVIAINSTEQSDEAKVEIFVIVFSALGVLIVFFLLAVCIFFSVKKTKKFIESVKSIPEEWTIANSQPHQEFGNYEEICKEEPVPLDGDELKRIEKLHQKPNLNKECNQNETELQMNSQDYKLSESARQSSCRSTPSSEGYSESPYWNVICEQIDSDVTPHNLSKEYSKKSLANLSGFTETNQSKFCNGDSGISSMGSSLTSDSDKSTRKLSLESDQSCEKLNIGLDLDELSNQECSGLKNMSEISVKTASNCENNKLHSADKHFVHHDNGLCFATVDADASADNGITNLSIAKQATANAHDSVTPFNSNDPSGDIDELEKNTENYDSDLHQVVPGYSSVHDFMDHTNCNT